MPSSRTHSNLMLGSMHAKMIADSLDNNFGKFEFRRICYHVSGLSTEYGPARAATGHPGTSGAEAQKPRDGRRDPSLSPSHSLSLSLPLSPSLSHSLSLSFSGSLSLSCSLALSLSLCLCLCLCLCLSLSLSLFLPIYKYLVTHLHK